MNDILNNLYKVVTERKENPQEGSYTCYLFEQGLDKILKKVGEECSETIIAAKNLNQGENSENLIGEICDLYYHLTVLMVQSGISYDEIFLELQKRTEKIGNLKKFNQTDKNS